MTKIKCPACKKHNIQEVALIPHSYMSWGTMHYHNSHLMQCIDCKTIFELLENLYGELIVEDEE
jgi:hypothetical protein